jgi:hypothetical protein
LSMNRKEFTSLGIEIYIVYEYFFLIFHIYCSDFGSS